MDNTKIKESRTEKDETIIIEKILKKYGLFKVEDEEVDFDKFLSDPAKYESLITKSASYKLSSLIRKYRDAEISLNDMPTALENELGIPKEKAKKLTEELNREILRFIEPAEKKPSQEELLAEPKEESIKTKELPRIKRKDSYREPIE